MDPCASPVDALQQEMGKALDAAIDAQGGKVAFAKKAGLNRATLYRMLRGENVSTEILLRTLRALGRVDLITALIEPPSPSPLERRPAARRRSPARERREPIRPASLVSQLALGQNAKNKPHG